MVAVWYFKMFAKKKVADQPMNEIHILAKYYDFQT